MVIIQQTVLRLRMKKTAKKWLGGNHCKENWLPAWDDLRTLRFELPR